MVSIAIVMLAAIAAFGMAPAVFAKAALPVKKRNHYEAIVTREARANQINPRLLEAIITVESGWNPKAMRFESNYRYVRNVHNFARLSHVTPETERHMQRMALGLTQIVGGTARAIGYQGPLVALLDPGTNIHWGARYLGGLRQRYPGSERDMISAYNAGSAWRMKNGRYSNQPYVDMVAAVLRRMPK